MFHKYPEIVRLEKRPEILSVKQVVAVEKIHGTNFRVLFPEGMKGIEDVQFGGRNEEFAPGDNGFYGGRPVRWFKDKPELLQRMFDTFTAYAFTDVIVYGEAFGAGIQKGVRYASDNDVLFRAFDICVGQNFVTYDLFVELCDKMQLPRVPEVWRGEPSLKAFDALLEQTSIEAKKNGVTDEDNYAEGVVIRSNPLLRDVFGQWLIIKHKSEKFSEVKAKDPNKPRVDTSAAEEFAEMFVVRGRILNALGRLSDAGTPIKKDMHDMAVLVPAIVADLEKECATEWKEAISKGMNDKQVRGAVVKTLGSVYRRMLLEGVG